MPNEVSRGQNDSGETILEFVVRDRLTRQQIRDLLDSLGGSTSGNREEMAERLLGERGLREREVLSLLSLEDLKRVEKRFGIPAPKGSGSILDVFFGDETKALIDRIEKVASKQRAPRRAIAGQSTASSAPLPVGSSAPTEVHPARGPTGAGPMARPEVAGGRQPTAEVSFERVREFINAYRFAYRWDSEDIYEAELLGSLRGRFGINNATRQQGESGRVYDIAVLDIARIEVKVPKVKGELDRMIGQVRRYLSRHPGGVIVVIAGSQMKNQQEIHNAVAELELAGAVVFVK